MNLSLIDRELSITNYQNSIEWGKIGLFFDKPTAYHKVSKSPQIHYQTYRPGPIVLSEGTTVTSLAELPLVDHLGSFASKRRWDDKGTLRIQKSKTPRFAADSYLGEKPFIPDSTELQPLPIPNANRTFCRSPEYVFPGIKKTLDPSFLNNKEALFKSIIQGKHKPSDFREFVKLRKLQSEPKVKVSLRKNEEEDWLRYIKK